jgi:hypothetical protein
MASWRLQATDRQAHDGVAERPVATTSIAPPAFARRITSLLARAVFQHVDIASDLRASLQRGGTPPAQQRRGSASRFDARRGTS